MNMMKRLLSILLSLALVLGLLPGMSVAAAEPVSITTLKSEGVEIATQGPIRIYEWTITYNPEASVNAANTTVTDEIGADAQKYMKYTGNGITVTKYDGNGKQDGSPKTILYSDLTQHSDWSWTYTVPANEEAPYKYVINYQTEVNQGMIDERGERLWLENFANGTESGASVDPQDGRVGLTLAHGADSNESEISWIATLEVPYTGLSPAELTFFLPHTKIGNDSLVDAFKSGSLNIDRLEGLETCVVDDTMVNDSQNPQLKITFYKKTMQEEAMPGLYGGGANLRTITISFKTNVNQDWLKEKDSQGWSEHTLRAKINTTSTSDPVIFGERLHTHDGVTFEPWNSSTSLPDRAGNYYLTKDVTLSERWNMPASVVLCLNGYGIWMDADDNQIIRTGGNSLTLFDCNRSNSTHYITLKKYRGRAIDSTGSEKAVDKDGNGVVKVEGGFLTSSSTKSNWGGAVQVADGNSTFVMNGGTIIGNNAIDGPGAIRVNTGSSFEMNGGAIIYNKGTGSYGAVSPQSNIKISGNPVFANNVGGDIYLDSNAKIELGGALTNTAPIGISMNTPGVFTTGSTDTLKASDYKDKFTSNNSEYVVISDGKELKLDVAHIHNDVSFEPWTNDDSLPGANDLTNGVGSYYLTKNVTLDTTWTVPVGTMNLCLNGYSIIGSSSFGVINIGSGAKLNLYDCSNDAPGYITQGLYGVKVDSKGTFNMYGGGIGHNTKGFSAYGGSGVYNEGTFNMYDGTISNNTTNSSGGGVYNSGTFNMHDGTISGNTAGHSGGGVYNKGMFNMYDGTISNNTTNEQGGGVLSAGTFNLSGNPSITENTLSGKTNNVHLLDGAKIRITNALTSGASVGITMDRAGIFTSGYKTYNGSTAPTTFFISDDDSYSILLTDDGTEAQLAIVYAVTFDANGHGTAPNNQNVVSGGKVTKPEDLTAEGYSFEGWYKEATCKTAWNFDSDTVSADTTLYAKWKGYAAVTKDPTAKTLTYTGSAQELVTAGEGTGGTMKYAVTTVNTEPGSDAYTFDNTSIPKATDAGTYYVWYKVIGDADHNDTKASYIEVTIRTNKDNLTEAIADAGNYKDKISDYKFYEDIENALKDAIDQANTILAKENATQQEIDDATDALNDAVTAAKKAAVTALVEEIKGLPANITDQNKGDVEAIEKAYDELSDSQKTAVDKKLSKDDQDKLSDMEKAAEVADMIGILPDTDKITEKDEAKVAAVRLAYDLLADSQKELISDEILKKLTDAEEKLEGLEEQNTLAAAIASAISRLQDYSGAKAIPFETAAEQDAYDNAVKDGIKLFENVKNQEEVATALTNAKTLVNNALKKIEDDRAAAAAAAEAMAAADKEVADAKAAAGTAKTAADEAAKDPYASDADKQAIEDAKVALESAVAAADGLLDNATVQQKEAAAKAIEDAVGALEAATDTANVNSAAVRAEAEEAATAAQQLQAARDSATDRLDDYSEAKAKADFTAGEQAAYDKAVNDGKTAIGNAKNKEEVASALTEAKTAVDNALKKIEQDRADAAAAAEEMAAADKALADTKAAAGAAETAADKASADIYASDTDKEAIEDAKAALERAVGEANRLPEDATAQLKNAAAEAIKDAVEALNEATDEANVHSAAVREAAEEAATAAQQLEAAKDSATERLEDYSEVKAKSDFTAGEQAAYDKAVNDGKTAIGNAKNKEEVASALTDAKTAVDNAIKKIEQDRADTATAAEEMAASDKAVEDAGKAAAAAKAAADKAAADIYASDADKEAIEDAKAALESAVAAADGLPDNATAKQKNDAAKAIEAAVGALEAATDAANVNSAAVRAAAEGAATAAQQLEAAKDSATDRLEDYSEAKAKSDFTPEEQAAYDKAVADGKTAIGNAKNKEEVASALAESKAAVDTALAKINKDRTDAADAAAKTEAADKALADAKTAAADAKEAADKAAADQYASDTDKEAIDDAKAALESAVEAAEKLLGDATAQQKNDAAKAVKDAVGVLNTVTDAANVNSAAAKAAAQESAAEAKQLVAARTYAISRLEDYSEAKAMEDATEEEKAAYDKAVAEGIETIKKAEDEDAVSAALKEAKKAVNAALAKIEKDRADAATAAKEKAAADKAEADAKKAADEAAKKAAEEAAKKAAEAEAAASAQAAMENKLSIDSKLKVSQKGSKAVVAWGKVKDADHYIVYGGYGNKKAKKLKTVKAGAALTVNITKLNGKKLDLTKNYKFYVAAYKTVNGKKVTLCKTMMAHIVGRKNTTFTNIKNIKLKTKRMNLTVGKSRKIKAKLVLVDPKKKMLSNKHAPKFRYATSDSKVATVSKKGKVTARGKGQCVIWVYAKNGFAKKVNVTVK